MGKDKAQKVEGRIRNSSADSASDPWHQELAGAWRDSAAAGPQSPSPSQSPSLTIIYIKNLIYAYYQCCGARGAEII